MIHDISPLTLEIKRNTINRAGNASETEKELKKQNKYYPIKKIIVYVYAAQIFFKNDKENNSVKARKVLHHVDIS